jgi:hypothetical protein
LGQSEECRDKISFAIKTGGKKRLDILYRGLWKDITVAFDGNPLDKMI